MTSVLIFPALGLVAVVWALYSRHKELTVGGWRRLAERHPAPGVLPPVLDAFHHQSLRLSWWGRYNNIINIAVTENGFQMQPQWPYAKKRPPIFLDWSDVKNVRRSRHPFGGVIFDVDEYTVRLSGLGRKSFHRYLMAQNSDMK
jgi:hypothetical protein